MDKCPEPFAFDSVAVGYTCPSCGKPQVTDEQDAYLWCINKDCEAFAIMMDANYKEQ